MDCCQFLANVSITYSWISWKIQNCYILRSEATRRTRNKFRQALSNEYAISNEISVDVIGVDIGMRLCFVFPFQGLGENTPLDTFISWRQFGIACLSPCGAPSDSFISWGQFGLACLRLDHHRERIIIRLSIWCGAMAVQALGTITCVFATNKVHPVINRVSGSIGSWRLTARHRVGQRVSGWHE